MDQDFQPEDDGKEELQMLLEQNEQASAKVAVLQELIRKADGDEEEEEEVPEEKIWTKAKAEAQYRVEKVEETFDKSNKDASAVVQGVKGFIDSASKETKEKKYNQQKWGLFETNYQREKGIDVYQSLDEIEKFQQSGELPEDMKHKAKGEIGASTVRSKLEENMMKDGTSNAEAFAKGPGWKPGKGSTSNQGGMSSGMGGSNKRPTASEKGVNDHLRQEKNLDKNKMIVDFTTHLKSAGDQGSKFFDKYQKEQEKKFKPSRGM